MSKIGLENNKYKQETEGLHKRKIPTNSFVGAASPFIFFGRAPGLLILFALLRALELVLSVDSW